MLSHDVPEQCMCSKFCCFHQTQPGNISLFSYHQGHAELTFGPQILAIFAQVIAVCWGGPCGILKVKLCFMTLRPFFVASKWFPVAALIAQKENGYHFRTAVVVHVVHGLRPLFAKALANVKQRKVEAFNWSIPMRTPSKMYRQRLGS